MNKFERGHLVEVLDLDRDVLEQVAHRTHQWGQAISNLPERYGWKENVASPPQKPSPETLRREAASLFTIAGSYRMLLDPRAARDSMREATMHLMGNLSTFAYPMAICAGEPWLAERAFQQPQLELAAGDRANVLLALAWMDITDKHGSFPRDLLFEHLGLARQSAQAQIGRMQIPLEAVIRVVEAARQVADEEDGPAALRGSLHDALVRMHDVTAAAMADRYHWRMLMSSVLPVEPEAAVLSGVAMAAAMRTHTEREILEGIDLPAQALVPLLIGGEMVELEP